MNRKIITATIILILLVIVIIGSNTDISSLEIKKVIFSKLYSNTETIAEVEQWNISRSQTDIVTATLYNDGTLIISGTGNMVEVYSSGRVAWNNYKDSIYKVEIQEGVTNICKYAFSGCSSLTSIEIPSSVTSIGEYAFRDCSSLTDISVCESNMSYKTIDRVLFNKDVTKIICYPGGREEKSYIIREGVTSIGTEAFRCCRNLTNIEISSSVTSIGEYAFIDCSSLTSINIPSNVTSIGSSAFSKCSSLTSIEIPNSVTILKNSVFSGCSSLTNINIPNSITSIENSAFSGCRSLTSIEIPSNVTSIGNSVFYACSSLTNIELPEAVTSIGFSAFSACSRLKSINIPSDVTNIKNYAFSGCRSLESIVIPEGVTSICYSVFSGCTSLKSIDIPDSVTSIEAEAFKGCRSLEGLEIHEGVISIGDKAFSGCSNLIDINVCEGNMIYKSIDGVLFNKNGTEIICYPGGKEEKSYTIPEGVTSIGNYAFEDCSNLTSIEIHEGVINIGVNDFYSTGIKEIKVYCNSYAHNHFKTNYNNMKLNVMGHTEVIYEGWAPTCTEKGKTEGKHCSVCNEVLVKQEIVEALGHTEVTDEGKVATCTDTGLTEGKHCSVCNEVLVKQEIVEALGHTEVVDEAVAPTCTDTGLTEGKHCSVCNEILEVQEEIAALGHDKVEHEKKEATCEEKGWKAYETCNKCEYTTYEEIPTLGHTEVTDEGKVPTCTDTGLTEGKHCSVCNKILEVQEEIAALGHSFGDWKVIKEATEIEEGEKQRLCNNCEHVEEAKIPILNLGEVIETWNISATENDNVIAVLYSSGRLNINGIGNMKNYNQSDNISPWYNYKNLIKEVIIKEGITGIGTYAFYNCINIIRIEIPEGIKEFRQGEFSGCTSLENIELPNSTEKILNYVFQNCSSLTEINIPARVKFLYSTAITNCHNLENINVAQENNYYSSTDGILFNKDYSELYKYPSKKQDIEYSIPDSVELVDSEAFERCNNLRKVNISENISHISQPAFEECSNLEEVNVNENNNYYSSENGILFNEDKTKILYYPNGKKDITEYIIPNSVINIEMYAFRDCNNLTSVKIPNSVNSIKFNAFYKCENLISINIPNSVTYINSDIFYGCNNLEKINVYCNSYAEEYVTKKYYNKLNVIHTYDEVITTPTCIEKGYTKHTCIRCNDSYIDTYVDAWGHTEVEDNAVEPTCTEKGKTEGKHCLVCNEVLVAQEEILALGHTEVIDAGVEATCTEEGRTEGKHCLVCNEVLIAQEEIAVKAHEYQIKSKDDAVCELGGKIIYECTMCKDIKENIIPALGHTEVIDEALEPTCTGKGKTEGKHCSICKEVLVAQKEVPSLGHRYSTKVILPTCTTKGYTSYSCTRCEEGYANNYTNELGHTEVIDKAIQPTCIQAGKTEGKHCSVCNEVLVVQEEVLALGHIEVIDEVEEATCTQAGKTEGKHCLVCNEVLVVQEEVAALGHSFGEWIIDKQPTQEEEGHKYRECINCNTEKEEQIIPSLSKEELEVTTIYTIKEMENIKFIISNPNTNVNQFLSNITSNKELKVVNSLGEELKTDELVGTGAKVLTREENEEVYTVVLKADVNGDGKITFKDIITANAIRINNNEDISKAVFLATDIDNSKNINFLDIIKINSIRINSL